MAVQSSYTDNIPAAFHGMIADTEPNVLISRTVEPSAGLGFGVPVIQGTEDMEIAPVAASSETIVGITCRANDTEADSYAQYESALVMRKGVMWVTVTDAGGVSAGDPVWVTVSGSTFANADAGTDGSILINDARWETSAANGALARIRFDLDGGVTAGAS